jgi:ParB/RepB/Spo0J family partition protein
VDPQTVEEIATSIKDHGLAQIPVGRERDGYCEIGDGYLRWEAFKLLHERYPGDGYHEMPAVIRDLSDQQMADLALQANLKRKDLSLIDLAKSYRRYLEEFKVTQEELAASMGISQPALANTIRLLELPEQVQQMIISQEITPAHGRQLLKLKDLPDAQVGLAAEVKKEGLTVRQLDRQLADAVQNKWRRVSEEGWPRPKFDLKKCKTCDQVEELSDWRGTVPYCKNPECWDKKQAAAEAKLEQQEQSRLEKLAKDGVVALDKVGYSKYKDWSEKDLEKPQECDGCEHKKAGKTSYGDPHPVCLNPRCYSRKQSAATKARNQKAEEEYKGLLEKTRSGLDLGLPFSRPVCLLVLDALINYEEENALAKFFGIVKSKNPGWTQQVHQKINEQEDPELRWMVVRVCLDSLHRGDIYQYSSQRSKVAKAVARILGEKWENSKAKDAQAVIEE